MYTEIESSRDNPLYTSLHLKRIFSLGALPIVYVSPITNGFKASSTLYSTKHYAT